MEKTKIEAQKREVSGKAVRHLRAEGWVPGVLYGHRIEPLSIQVDGFELNRILKETGGARLLRVEINAESRTVLPREIQRDPISRRLLHIDLQEVVMTEKVTTRVRIHLVGEAPAVEKNRGVLVQSLDEVEIRALPDELIDHLEVDISGLTQPDDAVHLADVAVPAGVEVLHDLHDAIARILPLRTEEELEAEPAPAVAEPQPVREPEEALEEEEPVPPSAGTPAKEAPEARREGEGTHKPGKE